MGNGSSNGCCVAGCDSPLGKLRRGMCGLHYQRWKNGRPLEGPRRRVTSAAGQTCSRPDCDEPVAALDLCSMHWQRQHQGRDMDAPRPVRNLGRPCSIDGCTKLSRKRGWCPMHYERWKAHGDPLVTNAKVKGTCTHPGCERPHNAHGYCLPHARRAANGADMDAPMRPWKAGECAGEGCTRRGRYRGYCGTCRDRLGYAADPESYKARVARRRARLSAWPMTDEDRDISASYREAIADDPCAYCGDPDSADTDHVFPIAKGGSDHWWNLTRACPRCNRRKWAYCGTRFRLSEGDRVTARLFPAVTEAGPVDRRVGEPPVLALVGSSPIG